MPLSVSPSITTKEPMFSSAILRMASYTGSAGRTEKTFVAFFTEQLPDRCHRRLPCARATQGFATELTGAFEAVPVVTGGELIISRLVFTRLVLISAHTKKIDVNRHMMAKKPV